MAHSLVVGMTMSGKTTLAKLVCRGLKQKGIKTAVLDPLRDPDWDCDFRTADADEFLSFVKSNKSHVLFVDESGDAIGRYNKPMEWLATQSRHLGHKCWFLCQASQQLSTIIRGQCSTVYLFNCTRRIYDVVSEDFNEPVLRTVTDPGVGEFYVVTRMAALTAGKVLAEIVNGEIDLQKSDINIGKIGDVHDSKNIDANASSDAGRMPSSGKSPETVGDGGDESN